MKRFSLWLVLFVLLGVQSALAQSYTIKGSVVSKSNNEPLIGVSILQKGTTNGVVTDIDGNYVLQVQGGEATLVFSYIGMQTQELKVNSRTGVLNVVMQDDTQLVDEVVVVAYGVRKKGTIAGSVSTVKGDKFESVPAASFDQALQGQASGLQVMSNSGEPSAAASFQIRGVNSINAGVSPLFILDGIAVSADDFSALNPSDIESVSVLKDASSTSIYGARAANGVVVITTKRGKMGEKGHITARAQYGVSKLAYGKWNQMNTSERLDYEEEIGLRVPGTYDRELLERTNIDWRDAVYNDNAPFSNVELQFSGASDRYNYYVSGGVYNQEGIALGSDFTRYSFRANLEAKLNSWFKIGTNSAVSYEDISEATSGEYTTVTPISAARFMLPYWNPYKADGSYASVSDDTWLGTNVNPLEWQANNPTNSNKWKVMANLYGELRPIEGLVIKSIGGIDFLDRRGDVSSNPSYLPNMGEGYLGRSFSRYYNLTWTNTINYVFDYKDDHHFNVLLGQEAVNNQSEAFSIITRGQSSDKLLNMASATRAESPSDSFSGSTYLSFFARGEYNYQGKYYADFSVRRDGSSRFGKNSRWANFWSVGLMWDAKREAFLEDYEWLTNAQLSASVGTSGNSSIPPYDHLALFAGGPTYGLEGSVLPGIAPYSRGNEDLTWEKLLTTNIALKLGFFDRINVVAEFYHKKTTDMLMAVPVTLTSGYVEQWDNIGAMVNKGVDLSFDIDILRMRDFRWNVGANISYNHNEITELYGGRDVYELANTNLLLKKGHSYGEFYVNRFAGVNPVNGDALWYDKDGNITNVYSENDKVLVGKNSIAPWQGGFSTMFSWKGLSVSAQFSWVKDRWVMNNDRYFDESNGMFINQNQSKKLLYDRWKKPGDIASVPRHGVVMEFDDRLLEDASFLRLKNLNISYSFDRKLLQKTRIIENLRVFAQAQNLFTFTKFQGMDPESTGNMYQAQYPMSRQFSIGLEVGF